MFRVENYLFQPEFFIPSYKASHYLRLVLSVNLEYWNINKFKRIKITKYVNT